MLHSGADAKSKGVVSKMFSSNVDCLESAPFSFNSCEFIAQNKIGVGLLIQVSYTNNLSSMKLFNFLSNDDFLKPNNSGPH